MPRTDYQRHKEAAAARSARISAAGRDVAPLPPVADPTRKAHAARSLRLWCEIYFPEAFALDWSDDHLRVIGRMQEAATAGGLFALAMPRGSGKTTLAEAACLWAVFAGHSNYAVLIRANAADASKSLANMKTAIQWNDRLAADFPEVCYPIRCLGAQSNRAKGQTYQGRPTLIDWVSDHLVLPTIPHSRAAGAIITAVGIESGNIRGAKHNRPDGTVARPSFVLIDDPQTRETAQSDLQCHRREQVIKGDVLGMAGPGKKIAAVCCVTVVRRGDLADRLLNRQLNPDWKGERTKLLYEFPTNTRLWDEYAALRAAHLRAGGDGTAANSFYAEHRAEMDAGARVAWEARCRAGELSALQHAMNLYYADPQNFAAEYQNEPEPEEGQAHLRLTPEEIAAKTNGLARAVAPTAAELVTVAVDVQDRLLYWLAVAWAPNFTGYILDYGTYPDQHAAYFAAATAKRTMRQAHPGTGTQGAILAGLETVTNDLAARCWQREDGAALRTGRGLIDAGYETDLVKTFCKRTPHAGLFFPSHGRFIGASSIPMEDYRQEPGAKMGYHWRLTPPKRDAIRHVLVDINHWKTHLTTSLATALGDPGALSLWGRDPERHRLLADHLAAEFPTETTARGRTIYEWRARPSRPDNHWLDCLVYAYAAAAMLGAHPTGATVACRRRVKISERQARRPVHAH